MHIEIDVDAVAQLAKISLEEAEKEIVRSELEAIVGFARKLEELDTTGVEITDHIVPMSNVLRDDVVSADRIDRDELLKNAPTEADGYMTVPRTLE